MVNRKHYYFSVRAFGKIVDSHFSDYSDRYEADRRIKAVWNINFRLYSETEKILDNIKDPDCLLFPLYRGIGSSESDYLFETRADAEREYSYQIDEAISDRMYDL